MRLSSLPSSVGRWWWPAQRPRGPCPPGAAGADAARLRQPVALDHGGAAPCAQGQYLAHPGDVEGKVPNAPTLAGLPECLALLVPDASQSFEDVFAHAMWLKTWFQDRAAIALELLHRAGDDDLVDSVAASRSSPACPSSRPATC